MIAQNNCFLGITEACSPLCKVFDFVDIGACTIIINSVAMALYSVHVGYM